MLEGSHRFTYHPHVYPRMEWTILPLLRKHSPEVVSDVVEKTSTRRRSRIPCVVVEKITTRRREDVGIVVEKNEEVDELSTKIITIYLLQ